MSLTSLSMLDRLKNNPRGAAWDQFQGLYIPLIRRWLRRIPGLHDEADDVTHEVLIVVLQHVAAFDRQREGSFRTWLRQITIHRVRDYTRKRARRPMVGLEDGATEAFLGQLADNSSQLAVEWDREHDRHVIDRLLEIVRPDFQKETWQAFQRFALDGTPAAQVAAELGLTEGAVVAAKSRILRRLRDEAGAILDD